MAVFRSDDSRSSSRFFVSSSAVRARTSRCRRNVQNSVATSATSTPAAISCAQRVETGSATLALANADTDELKTTINVGKVG